MILSNIDGVTVNQNHVKKKADISRDIKTQRVEKLQIQLQLQITQRVAHLDEAADLDRTPAHALLALREGRPQRPHMRDAGAWPDGEDKWGMELRDRRNAELTEKSSSKELARGCWHDFVCVCGVKESALCWEQGAIHCKKCLLKLRQKTVKLQQSVTVKCKTVYLCTKYGKPLFSQKALHNFIFDRCHM